MILSDGKRYPHVRNTLKGSAQVVEAVIVLPVVMTAVLALVFAALYSYQCLALKTVTDRMAMLLAEEMRMPGINEGSMGSGSVLSSGFDRSSAYMPSADTVSDISGVHSPYRYIFHDRSLCEKTESETAKAAEEILLFSGLCDCSAEINRSIRGLTVSVSASASGYLPLLPGLPFSYKAFSEVPVADHCETVRNTDLVIGLFEKYMFDGNSFASVRKSIGEIGKNAEKTVSDEKKK